MRFTTVMQKHNKAVGCPGQRQFTKAVTISGCCHVAAAAAVIFLPSDPSKMVSGAAVLVVLP